MSKCNRCENDSYMTDEDGEKLCPDCHGKKPPCDIRRGLPEIHLESAEQAEYDYQRNCWGYTYGSPQIGRN